MSEANPVQIQPLLPAPLLGLRVLVTRPEGQSADFVAQLRALGAEPVICPTIRVAPPVDWEPVDRALGQLGTYDWVVFTSVNGVRFFFERLHVLGLDPKVLAGQRLAAIGPATAKALTDTGMILTLVPHEYVAEAILDEIGEVAGKRLLLPRADIARKALADGLRDRGGWVDEVAIYRTMAAGADVPAGPIDIATFTSPSTVRNFIALLEATGRQPDAYLAGARVACIGPITAQAVLEAGLPIDIEAAEHTLPGLIQAMLIYWEKGGI